MTEAKKYYTSGAPIRRIPVDIEVTAHLGQPLEVSMTDADGHHAEAMTEFLGEPAKKRPLTEETVRKQIDRLGTSVFALVELLESARLQDFDRPSKNKASRVCQPPSQREGDREAVVGVSKVRSINPSDCHLRRNTTSPSLELVVSTDTLDQTKSALSAGADAILFGGDSYRHEAFGPQRYEEALRLVRDAGKRIYFNTPRIVRSEHFPQVQAVLEAAQSLSPDGVYVQNIGMLSAAKSLGLPVCTDSSLVVANHETLAFFAAQGVRSVTLSPELTLEQVRHLADISPLPLECIVHGPLELMVSEYCVLGSFLGTSEKAKAAGKGNPSAGVPGCTMPCVRGHYALRDRKSIDFPIVCDQFCHMHILNSRPLSMLPHVPAFRSAGIACIRIDGRSYTPQSLASIVRNYARVLGMSEGAFAAVIDKITALEGKDFTRGHYFRGVAEKAPERGLSFK